MSNDLTKNEIKDKLDELGVDYDSNANKSELEKLLAAADQDTEDEADSGEEGKVEETNNDEEEKADENEDENEDEKGEDSADAEDEDTADEAKQKSDVKITKSGYSGKGPVAIIRDNVYIRTYSEEDHGKGFMKLAEQFCTNEAGREMINDEAINKVFVKYRTTAPNSGIAYQKTDEFDGKDKRRALKVAAEHNGTIVFQS